MDTITVDENLHKSILMEMKKKLTTNNELTSKNIRINRCQKNISIVVVSVVMLACIMMIDPFRILRDSPIDDKDPATSGVFENATPRYEEAENVNINVRYEEPIDIHPSQLIRKPTEGKVRYGYFFSDKMIEIVKNDSDSVNRGVYWEEHEFSTDEIESALHISVNEPILPDGTYTMNHYVLTNAATKDTIGYRTVYYYFDESTLEFQSSYSLFYLSEPYFKWDEIEELNNVRNIDGKIAFDDFKEPASVQAKVPYLNRLVYAKDGIAIVLEVEADAVKEGANVDELKSKELYRNLYEQQISMMVSIIE
jgi:hypothetical protein